VEGAAGRSSKVKELKQAAGGRSWENAQVYIYHIAVAPAPTRGKTAPEAREPFCTSARIFCTFVQRAHVLYIGRAPASRRSPWVVSSKSPSPALQSWLSHGALCAV